MVANVEFLLRWQGIIAPEKIDWVQSYLQLFHTYIQLGVSFGDMNVLKFSILKSKKTSRAKAHFPLPQNMVLDDSDDDLEVVMVTRKD